MALKENIINTSSITSTTTLGFTDIVEKTTNINKPNTTIETLKDTSTKPSISTTPKVKTTNNNTNTTISPTMPGETILDTRATTKTTNKSIDKTISNSNLNVNIASVIDKKFGIFNKDNIDCDTNDYLKITKASRNNNKKLINKNNSDCTTIYNITDDALLNIVRIVTTPNVLNIGNDIGLDSFIKNKTKYLVSKSITDSISGLSNLTDIKDSIIILLLNSIKNATTSTALVAKLYNALASCGYGTLTDTLGDNYDMNRIICEAIFDMVSCDSPDTLLVLAKALYDNGMDGNYILAAFIPAGKNSKNAISNLLNASSLKVTLNVDISHTDNHLDSILNGIANDNTYNKDDTNAYVGVVASLNNVTPSWDRDESNNESYHKVKGNNNLVSMATVDLESRDIEISTTGVIDKPLDNTCKIKIANTFV